MGTQEGNAGRERFLILAREAGTAAEGLRDVLESLGEVEVIVDRETEEESSGRRPPARDMALSKRHSVWVPDAEAAGFGGLMGRDSDFPKITAWSRAMVHLSRTLRDDEAVWLVEDDVAGDMESFARLVELTRARGADLSARDIFSRHEDSSWYFWSRADGYFEEPRRAFQPLCRLSARLLREILSFREDHGHFVFHEVLFASLAAKHGLSTLDWKEKVACEACFSTFRYRPVVESVTRGIAHPVKDVAAHEAIRAIAPIEVPRMSQAELRGWSILADDYVFLSRLCRRFSITRVAEFGPGDSTLALLDAGCRVISHEHDIDWMRRTTERFAGEKNVKVVHCPEGTLPEGLPFAPEMVFVDGPPFREGQAMSRIGPCEWALDTCGCFLLHDASRHGEQATLAEMERRGMQVTRIPTRKGMALVVDPARRPELIPSTTKAIASRYDGESSSRWFASDFLVWWVLFGESGRPVRILETGASDGMSANLLLDELFVHPNSEVHGIDLYDGEAGEALRDAFEANAERGGHAGQLHLYEGTTREVLAWMIAGEGFWESFDFIHLNGAESGADLLADACQAWSLLKPGGILVMGGGAGAWPGAEAFIAVFGDRFELLLEGPRVVGMKKA